MRIREFLNYPVLAAKYFTLKLEHNSVVKCFAQSAYKNVLNFEKQEAINIRQDKEILDLKERIAILTNDDKKLKAIRALRERRYKWITIA